MRILGKFKINITKKIKENIQKKIYNCREFDKKNFNIIGNITYVMINYYYMITMRIAYISLVLTD